MTTLTPVRLDRNEGAQPDAGLISRVLDDLRLFREYPDAAALEAALAERHGIDPAGVVVTPGADGALERACRLRLRPGVELLLTDPTFEMFPLFAGMTGATAVSVPWLDRFPTRDLVARIGRATGVVALVSPNNPTGLVIGREDLEAVARAAPDAIVIFDHVYADYAEEDLTAVAFRFPNVVVTRTFSKAWGLAGCRVGYALATPAIAARMRLAGPPYAVAGPSLAVAEATLAAGDGALRAHVARVREERAALRDLLLRAGIACPPSQANFLFPRFGPRVDAVRDSLARAGFVVRRFPDNPRIADALRISLPGDVAIYDRLVLALAKAIGGAS